MSDREPEPKRPDYIPARHHIDKRAAEVADEQSGGSPDDLFSTRAVAEWTGLSTKWFEAARCGGYGPKYVRLSPRRIRYKRQDVLDWLNARSHQSTAEYV